MFSLDSLTSPSGLRRVLAADAVSGAASGVLQLGLTGLLSAWLGLPAALLQGSGLALLGYVALAAWLAWQPSPPRAALTALVIGNFVWVAGCLAVAFGAAGTIAPLGLAYALVQAVVVLLLAELQWMALRRARRSALA